MLRSSAAVAPVRERDGTRAKPPATSGGLRLFSRARAIVSLIPWDHAGFRRTPARCLLRLVAWRLRCLLSWPAVIELPRWQAQFLLPAAWGGAGTTMIFMAREDYEIESRYLDRFIAPGDVVVDAGASLGIYTVGTAKLVGAKGRVLAFEPGRESFSVLERNIKLNLPNNVRCFRSALSERDGVARLFHHENRPVSSSLGSGSNGQVFWEQTRTTTLDTVAEQQGITRLDLLKMDVEGAEEPVLGGGRALLSRSRPTILFETNPGAARRLGLAPDGAWQALAKLGYRFFSLRPKGILSPLAVWPERTMNVVALHPEGRTPALPFEILKNDLPAGSPWLNGHG